MPTMPRVQVVSSIAATGPSNNGKPLTEESPLHPITNYGLSKVNVEALAHQYGLNRKLPVIIVRPSMVFGEGIKAGPIFSDDF